MKRQLSEVLDECLAAVLSGEATAEEYLERHPEHAGDVRPLLEVAHTIRQAHVPACDPAAFAAGRRRMLQALSARPQPARPSGRTALVLQRALAAAAAILLITAAGLLIPAWRGTSVSRQATLANASGLVEVLPAGADAWREALVGERFESGDRIRTTASASAVLAFFDGSATWLDPETDVTLTAMNSRRDGGERTTALFQSSGGTFSSVQPLPDDGSRFEIETAAAIAAVHGTQFALRVEESGATHVAVTKGTVRVTAGQVTVELRELEETDVEPEKEPDPPRPATEPIPTPALPLPEDLPQPPTAAGTVRPPGPTATPEQPEDTAAPDLTGDDRTPKPTAEPIPSPTPSQILKPQPTPTSVPPGQTKTPPGQVKKTPKPTKAPKSW